MDPVVELQPHLRPGEQLLWYGCPDPKVWFAPADAFLIPFSIMWCGFAIFWEAGAASGGAPAFFALWGIPFIAMGVYFVVGRFIYKHRRKERTVYGITSQRAMIIVSPGFVADVPLQNQQVTIKRSQDLRHASVVIGTATAATRSFGFSPASTFFYANTGLDAFARRAGLPFAFYDVAEPGAMLSALDQARAEPAE